MTYEEQKEIMRTHVCLDCGAGLVLVHDPKVGGPAIRCGQDKGHLEYRLPVGPEEKVRRGEYPTGATEREEVALERAVARAPLDPRNYLATDVESGQPSPSPIIEAALALAARVELHPDLGHICIYRGKPRITIDGYYYHAARQARPVRVSARPMTAQERLDYQIAEGDHAWVSRGYVGGVDQQITGLGIVTQVEIETPSKRDPTRSASPVVARHPQRMAEKRAEWQLLRKLCPLGIEEEVDGDDQAH